MRNDCSGRLRGCRLLTNGPLADSLSRELAGHSDSFMQLLMGLAALLAERYAHTPLLDRIWEPRHNFTAYDAAYIALAEAANSVLYTSDEKLCKGHRARVASSSRMVV